MAEVESSPKVETTKVESETRVEASVDSTRAETTIVTTATTPATTTTPAASATPTGSGHDDNDNIITLGGGSAKTQENNIGPDGVDRSNLIVNYIPNSVNDMVLRQMFAPYGELESCRIVVDKMTRVSQGYGFVKYFSAENAQKAINALNAYPLEGKRLKVSVSVPRPKKEEEMDVYVAGFDPHTDPEYLKQVFSPYGEVKGIHLLKDQQGKPKGVGFVKFASKRAAQNAVRGMNGKVIGVNSITVGFGKQKQQRAPAMPNNMYVNPYYMYNNAAAGMPSVGSPTGAVAGNTAYINPYMARSPNMQNLPSMGGSMQGAGNMATIRPAMPMGQSNSGNFVTLFVYNVPSVAGPDYLQALFTPYGTVAGVDIPMKPDQQSTKGFAFVKMLSVEQATAAMNALNGALTIENKQLQVSFKK